MKNDDLKNQVQGSAAALGKLSAQKRLDHLTPEERSEWGRRLGQIWRDRKAAVVKAAS